MRQQFCFPLNLFVDIANFSFEDLKPLDFRLTMATRPFLFGGNPPAAASKFLVEFKAGKMVMKGKEVHAIKKKGTLYLNQTEDSLIHLCWKDRTSGQLEDDLIIFPDDAEFKRVEQCKTGRVFVLKFKSSSRRNFYWMQEPSEDKDVEYCTKINEYINNPPPPGSRSSGGSGASGSGLSGMGLADLGSLPDSELQTLLNTMSPQQLMQMLGGVGSGNLGAILSSAAGGSARQRNSAAAPASPAAAVVATPAATGTTTTGSTGGSKSSSQVSKPPGGSTTDPIQLSTLQSIISGLTVPPASASGGAAGGSDVTG